MKRIHPISTLFYYDGPQIIEARDSIGGHYLGVAIDHRDGRERFLLVGVSPERLRNFRAGNIDLRSLVEEGIAEEWFFATFAEEPNAMLLLESSVDLRPNEYFLPDAGFYLHNRPVEDNVLIEARERNNLVIEISVTPPEASVEHRIRVRTLAGLLARIQTLVQHAFGASIKHAPSSSREVIDITDAHLLDVVVPAGAGSFSIMLAASKPPDLFGQNDLHRAFALIDQLFNDVQHPESVVEVIQRERGRVTNSYYRLLVYLSENQMGLRYAWAEPTFREPHRRSISESQLAALIDRLSVTTLISGESIILDGVLDEADQTAGHWRLATDDGKFRGKVKEGGPSVKGLTIGTWYRFFCIEEIEESELNGRPKRTLLLTSYEELL